MSTSKTYILGLVSIFLLICFNKNISAGPFTQWAGERVRYGVLTPDRSLSKKVKAKAPKWRRYNERQGVSPHSWTAALTKRRRFGKVVELGAGRGGDTLELLKHSRQVVAVDIDGKSLREVAQMAKAQGRESGLVTAVRDFRKIDFDSKVFRDADLVSSTHALPFIPPSDFNRVWQHMTDSIRPGGMISVTLFGKNHPFRKQPGHNMTFHNARSIIPLMRDFKKVRIEKKILNFFGPAEVYVVRGGKRR